MEPIQAKAGPRWYKSCTLTKPERDDIYKKTGVSASIRARPQWQGMRGLTLTGPSKKIDEAFRMADKIIRETAGGPKGLKSTAPDTAATADRRAFAERAKRMVEASDRCGDEEPKKRKGAGKDKHSFVEARPAQEWLERHWGEQQQTRLASHWYHRGAHDQWSRMAAAWWQGQAWTGQEAASSSGCWQGYQREEGREEEARPFF